MELNSELVKKFPAFKPTEGLLHCSQEPATGSYSEPDISGPYHPILFLKTLFSIISNGLPPSRLSTNILHAFLASHISTIGITHLILFAPDYT